MIPDRNDIILLLSHTQQDVSELNAKLIRWGYTVVSSKGDVCAEEMRVCLILIEFKFYASPYNIVEMQELRLWSTTEEVPIVLIAAQGHLAPQQAEFPFLTLSNDNLIRDYIRVKMIEGQNISDINHFTRSLLRKEREKDLLKHDLDGYKHLFDTITSKLNEKFAVLDADGKLISSSRGFNDFFRKGKVAEPEILQEGLSTDDYIELQHIFSDFKTGLRTNAIFEASYKDACVEFEKLKIYLTNLLQNEVKPCILLTIENLELNIASGLSYGQKLWFTEIMEGLSDGILNGNYGNINSNIERILFLLPKIVDIKRVVVLLKGDDGNEIRLLQEWSRDREFSSGENILRSTKLENPKSLFDVLEDFSYKQLDLVEQDKLLHEQKDFATFCKRLNLISFVNIPIDNGTRVFGFLLLDLHSHQGAGFEPSQISGQLISEALAFGTNKNDKGMGSYAYDFLNFLPVPVFIKDFSHRWVLVNDSMLDFIGKSRGEVIGKTDYDLFGAEIADVFWETDELVLNEKVNFQNEEYITTEDGKQRIVVTNKSLFRTADEQDVIVSTIKDVTKLKQIEKDLRERTEHLRKSERKLKTLNSTKDRFFSIIAHDLKNPFNTLVGFSSILSEDLESFDKAEIEEFVKIIYDAAQHGYKLLENLLDWARTQTGKFHFEPIVINIQYLVQECLSLLNRSAERKNIEIISHVTSPIYAFADSNMVEMVIRNLLSNAVKFTYTGGTIELEVRSLSDKMIEIIVSDNGMGMSNDDMEKLFRIDVEFTKHGTDSETGTGLGLILCKEFIEKNRGEIYVQSKLGEGSRFAFTLPKNKEVLDFTNMS